MNEELNILDYVKVIRKWGKFIVSFTSASVILTVLVCLVMPWTYRAETSLLIPSQTGKGLEGLMALSTMVSGTTMNMPADLTDTSFDRAKNFTDIIKSRTMAAMLINGLDLKKYFHIRSREKFISFIMKKIKVKEQKGLLKIYVDDRDPRLSADMANYTVAALDQFNKKSNMLFAGRMRKFIGEQMAESKIDLDDAESKLKKFETQTQMVKISEKELSLERLLRDVKVKEEIYATLMGEYEKAKIDEAKAERFFEVLDPAYTPVRPYIPKPFLYSVISVVLGGFCGTFLAFFFEYLQGLGVNVPQIDYEKEIKWANKKIR
jgi:uncharacterized protein involved in exopolysaccharide biosynthesis